MSNEKDCKIVEYHVEECIYCSNRTSLRFWEYYDVYGYKSEVLCKECGNNETTYTKLEDCIKNWNIKNDIEEFVKNKIQFRNDTENGIISLNILI